MRNPNQEEIYEEVGENRGERAQDSIFLSGTQSPANLRSDQLTSWDSTEWTPPGDATAEERHRERRWRSEDTAEGRGDGI